MTVLHPLILAAGLASIAIPIAIHLFMRRRRRIVRWSAMRFLIEAYKRQRRRLRLEQMLLLATRCLLLALLGAALARPMLAGSGGFGGDRTVYLLLDNSLASTVTDASGTSALERHKALGARVLAELDGAGGDRAALITLGGPAEALVSPPAADIDAVARVLARVEPTDSSADLAGGADQLAPSPQAEAPIAVLLSDFLSGSIATERSLSAVGATVLASRPATEASANVGIETMEPLRPVLVGERSGREPGQVRVSLRRSGDLAAGVSRITLTWASPSGPSPAGEGIVRWEAGRREAAGIIGVSSPGDALPIEGRSLSRVIEARLEPDAIAGDNTRRAVLAVRRVLSVGIAGGRRSASGLDRYAPADWLALALSPGADGGGREIETRRIDPANLDAARLAGLDAIFIAAPDAVTEEGWRQLARFVERAGLVVVSPPPDASAHVWADAMLREFELDLTVAREATVYAEPARIQPDQPEATTLPERAILSMIRAEIAELSRPVGVSRVLPVRGGRPLLALADGTPLLVASERERGMVVVLTVAPDLAWTDLPAKPLMVPLFQELVRQGVGRAVTGRSTHIAGGRARAPMRTVSLQEIAEPGHRFGAATVAVDASGLTPPLRHAGLWRALDDRAETRAVIAVNPDAGAGDTTPADAPALRGWLEGLGPTVWIGDEVAEAGSPVLPRPDRSPVSLPLLIAALVVALVETGLARLASHAEQPSSRGTAIAPARGEAPA
jgi:hypothetical protein